MMDLKLYVESEYVLKSIPLSVFQMILLYPWDKYILSFKLFQVQSNEYIKYLCF